MFLGFNISDIRLMDEKQVDKCFPSKRKEQKGKNQKQEWTPKGFVAVSKFGVP